MYKITFYVPPSHLNTVKTAIFEAGAGKIGLYDYCSWQSLGEGQYRPLFSTQPFIGSVNQLEKIEEYRVEICCEEDLITQAIEALKKIHPYETPAYHVLRLENF